MNSTPLAIYVGKTSLSRNLTNSHDYAEEYHLYQLLSQATKILLRKNNVTSGQAINEFLQQCNRGQLVLLKSYGSFSKSVICKMCFLYNFMKIFEVDTTQRNGLDYYQLSRLLCSDFPREFIQRASGLLLPKQQPSSQMFKLLPSKKFTQAIYLFVIYAEYLEALQSHFQQEEELDFLQIYRVVRQEDLNRPQEYSKPPFAVMAQALLTLMRGKELLADRQAAVIFISEENIEDFIRDTVTNNPDKGVRFDELLQQVVISSQYGDIVEENLSMFENSQTWAADIHKVLVSREPIEMPLNVKKKASKK